VTANLLLDSLRDLWDGFIAHLPSIVTGLLAVVVFYLIARLVRLISARSLKKIKLSEHAASLVSRIIFVGVMVFGVVVSLAIMGVNAGALVASLGLVSVGIGFALKDVIENFLAGIIIILQKPFVIGDVVLVGDIEGMVEEVRVRDTVICMYDGRQVFVPNAYIFSKAVINNNIKRSRRIEFDVGISYTDDVSNAMRVAADALSGVKGTLKEPAPMIVIDGFEESSVGLKAYFWIDPIETNILEAKSMGIRAVKRALDEEGIEIPFPIVTIQPGS
jgi:small conductance mechanosensitive channel